MSSSESVSQHEDMNEAYLRDYGFKRKLDAAVRALGALLEDDDAHLGMTTAQEVIGVKLKLQRRSEHIVRVWD